MRTQILSALLWSGLAVVGNAGCTNERPSSAQRTAQPPPAALPSSPAAVAPVAPVDPAAPFAPPVVARATTDFERARSAFSAELQARLRVIDARMADLRVGTNAVSPEMGMALRSQRDRLAADLAATSTQGEAGWVEFRSSVGQRFLMLEEGLANPAMVAVPVPAVQNQVAVPGQFPAGENGNGSLTGTGTGAGAVTGTGSATGTGSLTGTGMGSGPGTGMGSGMGSGTGTGTGSATATGTVSVPVPRIVLPTTTGSTTPPTQNPGAPPSPTTTPAPRQNQTPPPTPNPGPPPSPR